MSDIVDRLEDRATSYEQSGPSAHHTAALLREAKNEIEHLRLEHKHACQEIGVAVAERDAADEVARAARLYVGAMQEKLAKAVGLLDALLGLERGSGEAAFAFVERYRADVGNAQETNR